MANLMIPPWATGDQCSPAPPRWQVVTCRPPRCALSSTGSGGKMLAACFLRFVSGAWRLALCVAAMLLDAAPTEAQQVEFPIRPIRIIVAASPGSADDFFARSLGAE